MHVVSENYCQWKQSANKSVIEFKQMKLVLVSYCKTFMVQVEKQKQHMKMDFSSKSDITAPHWLRLQPLSYHT